MDYGKLTELLNEYEPYIQSDGTHTDNFWWYVSQGHSAVFPKELGVEKIISKEYGFIKWLVDNNKIDKKKFEDEFFACGCCGYKSLSTRETCEACGDEVLDIYEALLMRLSIQDSPLEFLISILR